MKLIMKIIVCWMIVANGTGLAIAQEDLLGPIMQNQLEQPPFASWYNASAESYRVDEAVMTELRGLLAGTQIKIVMGTWCHDSKREVPRFYKIIEQAQLQQAQVSMIALDRQKQAPNGEIDGLGITNTPTFIFYQNGVEINRIVEKPVESLEQDMMKILSEQPYRHSKMP